MARFKRARRFYGKVKKGYHRRRGMGGGVVQDAIAGAVVGGIVQFGSPYINQYVPAIGPLRPTTAAVLGGGLIGKSLLHKGGKFADAAVIIGTAMLIGDVMASSGISGGSTGGGFAGE